MGFEKMMSAPSQAKTEEKPKPTLSLDLEDSKKGGATEQEKYAALNGAKIAEKLSGEKVEEKELTDAEKVVEFRNVGAQMIKAFKDYEDAVMKQYDIHKIKGKYEGNSKKIKESGLDTDAFRGIRGNMGNIRDAINEGKMLDIKSIRDLIFEKMPPVGMGELRDAISKIDISKLDERNNKSYSGGASAQTRLMG